MRQADIDDRNKPSTTGTESAELRDARRRILLPERENQVLRRAATYWSAAWPVRLSGHTAVRVLLAILLPQWPTRRVVIVNDFALRRRNRYGTPVARLGPISKRSRRRARPMLRRGRPETANTHPRDRHAGTLASRRRLGSRWRFRQAW